MLYDNIDLKENQVIFEEITEKNQNVLKKMIEKKKIKEQITPLMQNILSDNNYKYINECADYLEITDNDKIIKSNFCRNRLCPICNYRKSRKQYGIIYSQIKNNINNRYKYLLLTTTIKNCNQEDLNKAIDIIMAGFKRLVNNRRFKRICKGYIRTLEITYNAETRQFHPHLHNIIAVSEDYTPFSDTYITQDEYRKMWEQSAKLDYYSQVDIRLIKNIERGVAEVSKYALKLSNLITCNINEKEKKEAIKSLVEGIKNRRFMGSSGVMKCSNIEDVDLNDEMDKMDEFTNKYIYVKGKYMRIINNQEKGNQVMNE